jgi:rubrerythrin
MHEEHMKKLWEIRFKKVYDLEKESELFYQKLLEENKELLEGTKAKEILEQIRHDEIKHAKIAEELLNIVKQKKIQEKGE